jgi:septal ring factor EnvC (AmiA/AmiB activator)
MAVGRRRRRGLAEDVSRLNHELQTVYNDMNGLRRTQAAIDDALRQLRTDLTALEAAVAREGRLVDQLQDRHHQQLDRLRASVAAQQQLVGALDELLVGTSQAQDIA